MLLFSDGFDSYNIYELRYKWGFFGWSPMYPSYLPECRIVSGIDVSCNKPWATKNGRALYLGYNTAMLKTTFRPSRTLFTGFAFRCRSNQYSKMKISFGTKAKIDRGTNENMSQAGSAPPYQSPHDIQNPVGILEMEIHSYYISYVWTFTGGSIQVGSINTTMDMLNGDYHYIQAGMTLMGNVSGLPAAWCEVRIGNSDANRAQHQNILTSAPDGSGSFYMNCLALTFNLGRGSYDYPYSTIDDAYICNDEGTVNNGFLGNVKVRRVLPSAEGAENSAVPTLKYGDAYRFQAVNEDFIGSTPLPYPIPTPEQDPLFIPWEDHREDYLTLEHRGDRQALRFQSVDFAGSQPHLFGAIMHGLAMSAERGQDGASMLKGHKRTGLIPLTEAQQTDVPLSFERDYEYIQYSPEYLFARRTWQTFPMVFPNEEVVPPGQMPQIWNPTALNNSEFVIELAASDIDPRMYDKNLVRFNLSHEEVCSEFLGFVEFVHRFYDAAVAETFSAVDSPPLYERTFKITESLYWAPEISLYRTFHKSVNSELHLEEEIPWIFLFLQGQIGFADEIFLEWQDLVDESLVAEDWTTGFWEELFNDSIDVTDAVAAAFIERLEEMFGLEEPYVWDNHELVEEEIGINVSYVWDNHELMEEYFYPDDATSNGFGLVLEEEITLDEDHFDGWLVEQPDEHLNLAQVVLTQHWRYERFFGIVIGSWQVSPVEQEGQDGDHNGDNPWGW